MFALYNEFNDVIESRHRSVAAACVANEKLQRMIKKHNGRGSYMPTSVREILRDGTLGQSIDIYEIWNPYEI